MSKRNSTPLTIERLREVLDYCPETGLFTRKKSKKPSPGSDNGKGYLQISVDSNLYVAHKLAFFWVESRWPKTELDHKNRDRKDNRKSNLRELTRNENQQNASLRKDNSSGVKGVSWSEKNLFWIAYININKKSFRLGAFKCFEDAVSSRKAAEITHHPYRVIN